MKTVHFKPVTIALNQAANSFSTHCPSRETKKKVHLFFPAPSALLPFGSLMSRYANVGHEDGFQLFSATWVQIRGVWSWGRNVLGRKMGRIDGKRRAERDRNEGISARLVLGWWGKKMICDGGREKGGEQFPHERSAAARRRPPRLLPRRHESSRIM